MTKNLLLVNTDYKESKKIESLIESNFNNIKVSIASEVDDVFNSINDFKPDLILLDVDFPELDGQKCVELINEIISYKRLPIIILSSNEDYNVLIDAGAINFIHKPFQEITLLSNLKTALKLLNNLAAIEKQEKEIERKDLRINSQIKNELIQKDIIQKKNQDIMADIRYASRIQQAILPKLKFLNDNLDEYFILHQPKSHVGGDFYWVALKGNQKIIAVGDCTGHGISGALMHMLGAVYLNEIVINNNFLKASDIINKLRDSIMKSLDQTGAPGETQDGLDIALCIIDSETKQLQYAGANNPLYIIRNKELFEIKGDRMPVGIHINFSKSFTNNEFQLKSDDQLYMFSDGYADQFGGPRGKKLRYKQFKNILVENCHLPMNIQKEILNNTHDKWRGSLDQIDDILVFGLKIK